MANREEYTTCMIPWMKGGGEDRKLRFCMGAKRCSGKATNEDEARKLCAEAAANPKPPKQTQRSKGKVDTGALAVCVIGKLDGSEPTQANLSPIIASCLGQKAQPNTREKFIKKCFKENSSTGTLQIDIKEAQKLRPMCIRLWKEQEETTPA